MGSRNPPASPEAGGWACVSQSDAHIRTPASQRTDTIVQGHYLMWLQQGGENIRRWEGCALCRNESDCSCSVTPACFSCCSALLPIFWAWFPSLPVGSVNTISFQYSPINKLSRVCFCSRHCDELSKFPFKSEGFIFSAVEWAAGRLATADGPLQDCLSWRGSHYPRSLPGSLSRRLVNLE